MSEQSQQRDRDGTAAGTLRREAVEGSRGRQDGSSADQDQTDGDRQGDEFFGTPEPREPDRADPAHGRRPER
jgi:hypothetical protein